MIPGSSMVEQEAVNFEVAGSSPVPGATQKPFGLFSCTKSELGSHASRSMRVQSREPIIQVERRRPAL